MSQAVNDINLAPVVRPTDVGVEQPNISPLIGDIMPAPADVSLQSSPIVNTPPTNFPEIPSASKSTDNRRNALQSQSVNSPLSVLPAPVNIKPPIDLSEY